MPIIQPTTTGIYWYNLYTDAPGTITEVRTFSNPTQCSNVGYWGTMLCERATNKTPVFVGRGTIVNNGYTPSSSGSYVYKDLTSSYQTKFGTGAHCACGHAMEVEDNNGILGTQHMVLISYEDTIYYSDGQTGAAQVGGIDCGFLTGYNNNFVQVGFGKDKITGFYNLNGSLYVLMNSCIWVKNGPSELKSSNFRELVSNIGSHLHVNCQAAGNIYFANTNGIYALNGGNIAEISKSIRRYWQSNYDKNTAFLTYDDQEKTLYCKPAASITGQLAYNIETCKWTYCDHFDMLCGCSSPMGEKLFVMCKKSDQHLHNLTRTTVGADTVTQQIRTPFTACGTHGHETKCLSRVHLEGSGITNVKIYTRNGITGTGTKVIEENIPQPFVQGNQEPFQYISVEVNGTGAMVFKEAAIEFTRERI